MVKIPKKKDALTLKERRLIREIAKGKTVPEAARAAGYAEATIRGNDVNETLAKPRVQSAFQAILDKEGITDERLGKSISEGLDAYKVISANIIKNKSSNIAADQDGMKDADESTKDFVEVPDFMARHKFVDTMLKLKEHYPADKQEVEHSGTVSHVVEVVDYARAVRPKTGT